MNVCNFNLNYEQSDHGKGYIIAAWATGPWLVSRFFLLSLFRKKIGMHSLRCHFAVIISLYELLEAQVC
jgi:hypothetical protein